MHATSAEFPGHCILGLQVLGSRDDLEAELGLGFCLINRKLMNSHYDVLGQTAQE